MFYIELTSPGRKLKFFDHYLVDKSAADWNIKGVPFHEKNSSKTELISKLLKTSYSKIAQE